MENTGYVLAGGKSSRMGSDKALLEWRGVPLAAHAAGILGRVSDAVKLVGDPERYGHLGLPVIPDLHPGCGPLGGVEAALADAGTGWNLVVACDMPELSPEFLQSLLDAAARSEAAVVMAACCGRPEPLCAAWNRKALETVQAALGKGVRKMTDMLPRLPHILLPAEREFHFRNLNTPEDWAAHAAR